MAEKSMPDKMAVPSDNQVGNTPRKDSSSREESDHRVGQGAPRPALDGLPKKKSTFKITSITKNAPRGASSDLTYDADGDSLDDLDESHTEEVSSEILDSSRNTDVEVDPGSEDTTHNLTPDDAGKDKAADIQSRFKVVKIETHEPFRRGRWLCHDFLDPAQAVVEKTEVRSGQQEESHSGNSSAGSSIHYVHGTDDPSKNPLASVQPHSQGNVTGGGNIGQIGHMTTDQALPGGVQQNTNDFQPINTAQTNQQSSVTQIQGGVQNTRGETPVPQIPIHAQNLGQMSSQSSMHQTQQGSMTHQVQQVPPQMNQGHQGVPQGMPQPGAGIPQQQGIPGQQSQQLHHSLSQAGQLPNPGMSHSQSLPGVTAQGTGLPQVPPHSTSLSQPPPHNAMQPPVLHTSQGIPRDLNAGGLPASHHPAAIPDHMKNSVNQAGGAAVHIHPVGHPSSTIPHLHQSSLSHEQGNMNMRKVSAPSNLQSVPASDASALPNVEKLPHHGGTSSVAGAEGVPKSTSSGHANHLDSSKREFLRLDHLGSEENVGAEAPSGDTTERSDITTPLLTPLAAAVGGLSSPTKEGKENNPSGSNSLAIDNKIGEAMDLVKSHLMLTVRAEVAVLKEQIKELKEKNSKLEYENSVLKTAASPETLAKLSQP